MRTLAVTTFVTIDGVMQAPGGPAEDTSGGFELGGWLVPYADAQLCGQVSAWAARAEDVLLGRGTYELFTADGPYTAIAADVIGRPTHVATRTRTHLTGTAQVVRGDVVDAVRSLKDRDGGELQVYGSAALVQTLLGNDLVDELRLVVVPLLLGGGKRLFDAGTLPTEMRLVSSATTTTGALLLTYRRAGEITPDVLAVHSSQGAPR